MNLPLPAWVLVFVIGSMVGSFLNVCIHRLPREQSIVFPASHCPACRHPIAWFDNIPVLSFLLLGARCRYCRRTIHWRYPVVELVTAASAVAVAARFGVTAAAAVYFAFVCALIVVSFVDLEFQIIPDEISLGGLVVGVALCAAIPSLQDTASRGLAAGRSLIGALVGGGVLYVTGLLGDFIFRKESMGGGDIKLLAMAGSVLGWKLVLLTFFIAPIFALIPGLAVLLLKRSHIIPYGPFLSIGLAVSLFAGNTLLQVTGMEETIRLIWMYYKPW
ncbi:MAG: prepilin peptidase [Candidatus Omnitrophica bacterium]|nr:prepilin peptidase [Candidatus Omnitrophota bacterium]